MINKINFTSVQYFQDQSGDNAGFSVVIDGTTWCVPLTAGNRHYDEIMRQVEAGTLTIQDAD